MSLPNEGDTRIKDVPINVGELLTIAGVGGAVSGSINAMTVAAKNMISRAVGATVIAASPLTIAGIVLSAGAALVADEIVAKLLGDNDVLYVHLHLIYEIREIHKQGDVYTLREWKVQNITVSFEPEESETENTSL